MKTLKFPGAGGNYWNYKVPHTGITIQASNLFELLQKIRVHLNVNGFENAVIERSEIEDDVATRLSAVDPNCCYDSSVIPKNERKIHIADVIRLTRTLISNVSSGFERVDQSEADRRAKICSECQFNISSDGCEGCRNSGAAAAIVGTITGDRKTSLDGSLNVCAFCGCFNKAQIWFPLIDLQNGMGQPMRDELPSNCWKK